MCDEDEVLLPPVSYFRYNFVYVVVKSKVGVCILPPVSVGKVDGENRILKAAFQFVPDRAAKSGAVDKDDSCALKLINSFCFVTNKYGSHVFHYFSDPAASR